MMYHKKYMDIPEDAFEIPSMAFHGCGSLKELVIPDTIRWIGHGAFDSCTSLERIELPQDLQDIGYGAFRNCSSLTEMIGADQFVFPGMKHVFDGCRKLDISSMTLGVRKQISFMCFRNSGTHWISIVMLS